MTPAQWPTGQLITSARERAGLSKAAAARASGLSESWWRKLERGWDTKDGQKVPVHPTPEVLIRVANALHTPPGPILEAAGLRPTPTEQDLRADALELVRFTPENLLPEVIAFLRGLNAAR